MGLRYRKSYNHGPFRVNLSKSGVGWSVGTKGARFTKKANGGYRSTASIPGTGISYVKETGGGNEKSSARKEGSTEQAKKKGCGCLTIFLVFCAVMLVCAGIGKIVRVVNSISGIEKVQDGAIFTSEIPPDAVWNPESFIKFTEYPGNVSAGDYVKLSVHAMDSTDYSIVVYAGDAPINSTSLVSATSSGSGEASWLWNVPEDAVPGIYYIQVSDRQGNSNRIDYAILDNDGKIVGSPPDRAELEESTIEIIDIEPQEPEEEIILPSGHEPVSSDTEIKNDTVYITNTGSKYHRDGCRTLSKSCAPISRSDAISAGYEPCGICNP